MYVWYMYRVTHAGPRLCVMYFSCLHAILCAKSATSSEIVCLSLATLLLYFSLRYLWRDLSPVERGAGTVGVASTRQRDNKALSRYSNGVHFVKCADKYFRRVHRQATRVLTVGKTNWNRLMSKSA